MSDVHITVATGWVEGRTSLDVAHETALVKAALLYADRVTLASPRVALLASFATILVANDDERAEVALRAVQALPNGRELRDRIEGLRHKTRKSRDEIFMLRDLERQLRVVGADLAERVEGILSEAGVAELALAMSEGVVDLDPLGAGEPGGIDSMASQLGDVLATMVAPRSTTYPLLDDSTSDLLRAMIREGNAPGADLSWVSEPALATAWIGNMEAFPDAEMGDVLEARNELQDPLVRFRSAVVEMSRRLEATPMDDAFARAASQSYREVVEPALLELRELASEKKILALLKHETAVGSTRRLVGAGLGFVGATSAAIPGLVGAAVGVAGDVGAAMYQRSRDLTDQQETNRFFFLYEANRRLTRP